MPIQILLTNGVPASQSASGPCGTLVASVTNTGTSAIQLLSLVTSAANNQAVSVSQPVFLTPNVPWGQGFPTLLPGIAQFFNFNITIHSPYGSGPSPQQPGGAAPSNAAMTPNAVFNINCFGLVSDNTTASATISVSELSAIPPFPPANGGALQFAAGFNFINGIVTFTL